MKERKKGKFRERGKLRMKQNVLPQRDDVRGCRDVGLD
jgi:hypothetical protein